VYGCVYAYLVRLVYVCAGNSLMNCAVNRAKVTVETDVLFHQSQMQRVMVTDAVTSFTAKSCISG